MGERVDELPTDLALVVTAWPGLDEPTRRRIVELARREGATDRDAPDDLGEAGPGDDAAGAGRVARDGPSS